MRSASDAVSRAMRSRWLALLAVLALILVYGLWIAYQFARDKLYDFNLYYVAAAGLGRGVDVYGLARAYTTTNAPRWAELAQALGVEFYAPPYRYPPLTAQIVLPLTGLAPRPAGMIWLALSAAAFIAAAWQIGRLSHQSAGSAIALLALLFFVPPLTTLHAGQVNAFVLLAVVVAMIGLERGNDWLIGIGIAVGSLLKLVPVVLLFYLLWRRQWRAAAIAVAIMALLFLSATLSFGPEVLPAYFRNFLVVGQPGNLFPTPANQSLNGLWARMLSGLLPGAQISRIYLTSALLLVLATVAVCWPMRPLPAWWRYEVALIVCTILVITPYAWYHQFVLLLIPVIIVTDELWRQRRWASLGLLLMLYLLTDLHGLVWHSIAHLPWLTSFPLLFTLVLWGVLATFIIAERRTAALA